MIQWVVATVTTNCEKDPYYRVKVKSPRIWEESELMPSIGGIYLDVGDIVMVDISDGVDNAFIVRKLRYKEQDDLSTVDGDKTPIITEASDREGTGAWMYLRVSEGGNRVRFKTWKGIEVVCHDEDVDIIVPNDVTEDIGHDVTKKVGNNYDESIGNNMKSVAGNNYDIEAGSRVKITAPLCVIDATTQILRTCVSGAAGPFNGLPACLFTGAPHQNNITT